MIRSGKGDRILLVVLVLILALIVWFNPVGG